MPADRNWVRNLAVAKILLQDAGGASNPKFPHPEPGIEERQDRLTELDHLLRAFTKCKVARSMSVLISTTLAEALGALAAEPTSMVLAGGTDVMVEINGGHRRPESVIAVGRVPELRTWSHDADASTLRIGAGVTYAELEQEPFLRWVPALSQAARTVGSPQIRHAATLGGNVGDMLAGG